MSAGGHIDPSNKKVALLIAVLAAFLAFSETLGSSAQTEALSRNIEASNLWSFFQAKTIRMTTLQTAAEALEVDMAQAATPEAKAAIEKQDGHFTGDEESGNFDVTVMGNTIAGSYTSDGKELAIIIDTKPFFIPCEMVESFLKTKLA